MHVCMYVWHLDEGLVLGRDLFLQLLDLMTHDLELTKGGKRVQKNEEKCKGMC